MGDRDAADTAVDLDTTDHRVRVALDLARELVAEDAAEEIIESELSVVRRDEVAVQIERRGAGYIDVHPTVETRHIRQGHTDEAESSRDVEVDHVVRDAAAHRRIVDRPRHRTAATRAVGVQHEVERSRDRGPHLGDGIGRQTDEIEPEVAGERHRMSLEPEVVEVEAVEVLLVDELEADEIRDRDEPTATGNLGVEQVVEVDVLVVVDKARSQEPRQVDGAELEDVVVDARQVVQLASSDEPHRRDRRVGELHVGHQPRSDEPHRVDSAPQNARVDELSLADEARRDEVVLVDAASHEALLRKGLRRHELRSKELARVDRVAGEPHNVELGAGGQTAVGELRAVDRGREEAVGGKLGCRDDVRARVAPVEESREHVDEVDAREGLRVELCLRDQNGVDELLAGDEVQRQELAAGDRRADERLVDECLGGHQPGVEKSRDVDRRIEEPGSDEIALGERQATAESRRKKGRLVDPGIDELEKGQQPRVEELGEVDPRRYEARSLELGERHEGRIDQGLELDTAAAIVEPRGIELVDRDHTRTQQRGEIEVRPEEPGPENLGLGQESLVDERLLREAAEPVDLRGGHQTEVEKRLQPIDGIEVEKARPIDLLDVERRDGQLVRSDESCGNEVGEPDLVDGQEPVLGNGGARLEVRRVDGPCRREVQKRRKPRSEEAAHAVAAVEVDLVAPGADDEPGVVEERPVKDVRVENSLQLAVRHGRGEVARDHEARVDQRWERDERRIDEVVERNVVAGAQAGGVELAGGDEPGGVDRHGAQRPVDEVLLREEALLDQVGEVSEVPNDEIVGGHEARVHEVTEVDRRSDLVQAHLVRGDEVVEVAALVEIGALEVADVEVDGRRKVGVADKPPLNQGLERHAAQVLAEQLQERHRDPEAVVDVDRERGLDRRHVQGDVVEVEAIDEARAGVLVESPVEENRPEEIPDGDGSHVHDVVELPVHEQRLGLEAGLLEDVVLEVVDRQEAALDEAPERHVAVGHQRLDRDEVLLHLVVGKVGHRHRGGESVVGDIPRVDDVEGQQPLEVEPRARDEIARADEPGGGELRQRHDAVVVEVSRVGEIGGDERIEPDELGGEESLEVHSRRLPKAPGGEGARCDDVGGQELRERKMGHPELTLVDEPRRDELRDRRELEREQIAEVDEVRCAGLHEVVVIELPRRHEFRHEDLGLRRRHAVGIEVLLADEPRCEELRESHQATPRQRGDPDDVVTRGVLSDRLREYRALEHVRREESTAVHRALDEDIVEKRHPESAGIVCADQPDIEQVSQSDSAVLEEERDRDLVAFDHETEPPKRVQLRGIERETVQVGGPQVDEVRTQEDGQLDEVVEAQKTLLDDLGQLETLQNAPVDHPRRQEPGTLDAAEGRQIVVRDDPEVDQVA